MDSGYRASRCRRYHGAAYGPHSFSLFTWASARCCTGTCVKKGSQVLTLGNPFI